MKNKLKTVFVILIFFSVTPLFPQNRISFENAIKDFATDFTSRFPGNKVIAVVAFETDRMELTICFIDTMVEKLFESNIDVRVFERQRMEVLQREINFSLTGFVSDETAQRIGHLTGADTLIYGAFIIGNSRNEHRMSISAVITETGQILSTRTYNLQMDSFLASILGDSSAYLWTLGFSFGSSFSQPLLTGTFRGTIAPFRYSFLELGIDAGAFTRRPDESYYSTSPYAHYAFFWPFDKGGLYLGTGIGYWFSQISKPEESTIDRKILLVAVFGINVMDVMNISYTLRTNFANISNNFSVGYTYRFR